MGKGVAEIALAEGANVVVIGRSLAKAEKTAEALECSAEQVDIADDTSVKQLFERIGNVSHMMITAGAVGRSSFEDTPLPEAPALWMANSGRLIDVSGMVVPLWTNVVL